jgi:hypothetical protein
MKMEMRKSMNQGNDNSLESPWCPLFGRLPVIDGPPNTTAYRSIQIINQARSFWKVNDRSEARSSWPDPDEVGYSGKALLSARRIFDRALTICLNAQMPYGGESGWYKKPDGTSIEMFGPDQADEWWLISHAKDTIGVDRETEDHKILAVLSIKYAYLILRKILVDEVPEDDPGVLQSLQIASSFLAQAQALNHNNEIGILLPDAELGRKRREQLKEFARRPRSVNTERDIWVERGDELRRKNPGMKPRSIAEFIRKEQKKPPKALQNIYKVLLRNFKNNV